MQIDDETERIVQNLLRVYRAEAPDVIVQRVAWLLAARGGPDDARARQARILDALPGGCAAVRAALDNG